MGSDGPLIQAPEKPDHLVDELLVDGGGPPFGQE
jgi:hypothetical protein